METYHEIYSPLFQRQEQRYWSLKYMQGQMLDIERKSIEPMARALDGGNVQAMQQFTSAGSWQDALIIRRHQLEVGTTLGRKDGVIITDGCDFPKQGDNSVGSDLGHTLLVRRRPIESTCEECKGELGMDHYEVRNWRGWHHHMPMTMLSHHFLVRTRVAMGDEAPALTVSQVRHLLNVTLPKRQLDAQAMLEEIQRTQQQNYAAYRSHRKRRRKQKSAKPT